MEELVECSRCEGNACLHVKKENEESWLCFGCGFTTSNNLKEDSDSLTELLETLPELYKDIAYYKDGQVWLPSSINIPDKGLVFADGTDKDNWSWSAARVVEIPEEEKFKFPDDQFFKVDYKNKKDFKERDFMEALDYISFFDI